MKPKNMAWALHIFLISLSVGSQNLQTDRLNVLKLFQDCHINLMVSFDKAAQPDMISFIRTFHLDVETPILLHNPSFMFVSSQRKILRIRIPTKYLRFIVRKKHLSCFAYIYEQTYVDTLGLGEMLTIPVLLRSQIQKFKDNPDYILFLSERSIISPMFSLYNDFNKIGTTAIFLFILQCFTSIEIYCKVCNPLKSNEELFQKVKGTNVTRLRINEIFKTLHSDFRAEQVIHQNRVAPFQDCSPYKAKFAVPLLVCANRMVAFKLNYTIASAMGGGAIHAFHYAREPQVGAVIAGWFASPDLQQHLYKYDPRGTFDQLPIGDQFWSYGFVWTVSPNLAEAGIFRAFDISTWVCIVVSITIATLSIASVINMTRLGNHNILFSFYILVSIFLEQSKLVALTVQGGKGSIIAIFWAYIVIVISTVYKGNLFSALSTFDVPKVPGNIEEILRTKDVILTTSTCVRNYRTCSLLHITLSELLNSGKFQQPKLKNSLLKLFGAIKYTNSSIEAIASLDAWEDRTVYLDLSNETIILPNNLIFMGSKFEMCIYNLMAKIAGNKMLNLEGPEISLFARRIPFILQRTALLPPFTDALFRIVESGLWAYWAQYESAYIKLYQLKNFIESRKVYLEQEELLVERLIGPRKMNLVGLTWDPLPKWNPTPKLLGMNVVVPILKTLVWCLLVSFSMFLCEKFIPYLQFLK
ncbi:unnamed protein product [Allacma fusca]|uniref:Uncharacterized protein n=1 Tax=Allacma fusca TaxID=39272 RepID=A0A8J2PRJ4_9HEXA|nr:unnamed protein product [Allacma fusca]